MLVFGTKNYKLDKLGKKNKTKIYSLSLPSGFTCPHADICLSKANPQTGKITDGKNTTIRCFSASQEAVYPNVRKNRWNNFQQLKGLDIDKTVDLIQNSLPKKAEIVRIHVAGDFFSQVYFDAWIKIAYNNPNVVFYAYTKSLPYWIARLGQIPNNLVLTASYGGSRDNLIDEYNLRYVKIVLSEYKAKKLKLPIDHDDSHALKAGGNFALLIHGIQPSKTKSAKAISRMKRYGVFGYGKMSELRKTKQKKERYGV